MVKNKNKCAAKRKEQLAKLCAHVRSPLFPRPKSSTLLSPCSVPDVMPTSMTTPVSCSGSLVVLSSCRIPTSVSRLGSPAILLSCRVPARVVFAALFLPRYTLVFRRRITTLLSPLPVLGPPLALGS